MPVTFSGDMGGWLQVMAVIKAGGNPYTSTEFLNWPPFWLQILKLVIFIADHSTLLPEQIIQYILMIGEAGVILVTFFILKRFFNQSNPTLLLLIGLALDPISILLTCQHCNFDVFVALWILLFVWKLLDFHSSGDSTSWLWACFFLGLGIFTKTVPFILCPLLIIGIIPLSFFKKLLGGVLLLAPVTVGMSIIYMQGPQGVIDHVLHYRSQFGWFGITGILVQLNAPSLANTYASLAPFILILAMVYVSWRAFFETSISPVRLVSLALLLLVIIPTFGPGYAPQYINWFLPLLVIFFSFSSHHVRYLLVGGYVIAILTYITEYAFCHSHGSFMMLMPHTAEVDRWNQTFSAQQGQVLLRLPLFLFYLALTAVLVRTTSSEQ